MGDVMKAPTKVRLLRDAEWKIVERVFTADKLPYRWRLLVTDGAGANGRAFTIPTSLLTMAAPVAFFAAVMKNPLITAIVAVGSAAVGTVFSFANAGYIMSVGPDFYDDLTAIDIDNQFLDA